jgi:hypothetical protein
MFLKGQTCSAGEAYLAAGRTMEWVLAEWPRLSREAVQEALQLATAALLEVTTGRHESDLGG